MADESTAEETINLVKKDDSFLAVAILVAAGVLVIFIGIYLWKNRKLASGTDNSWKQSSFSPPPERAEFIAAKERCDATKISELDELKKLLMRRAIQTIPILLSLQNEGSSIERLYKRGMLTDDMHFKVKELKAFVDQEFQDIQFEADDLVEGWGQQIWPQAMQFHQMIQKQAEAKNEEQRAAEEEKKKVEAQKRKDKEKAKKAVDTPGSSTAPSANLSTPPSSSGAGGGGNPVISPVDAEAAKILEAERMAQLLLEEEAREKQKSSSGKKAAKK